ncbi:MAG: hypothetical protein ACT6FF_03310 [Methanosarcinaceae archaeon]
MDVVIKLGPIPIPIEIKYQEHPDDIGGVKEFMNEFDTGIGIVVTKNTLRLDGDILFVALPCFLQFADVCFCFNYGFKMISDQPTAIVADPFDDMFRKLLF